MPGSNFTFYSTIPAANDNPSVDQPLMLGNNSSVNGWVAQDHYGFNTSGGTNNFGGLHAQVTFAANNIPAGFSPPTLFTNNDSANTPQLFYYTGSSGQSSSQYTSSANGSTMLLGGIILKWGSQNSVNNGTTISFPSNFPNNCYQVICCPVRSSGLGSATINTYVSSVSTSGWVLATNIGSSLLNVSWFAIGN